MTLATEGFHSEGLVGTEGTNCSPRAKVGGGRAGEVGGWSDDVIKLSLTTIRVWRVSMITAIRVQVQVLQYAGCTLVLRGRRYNARAAPTDKTGSGLH